ncbi:MAG: dehydrogenase, short-chain alcohol dehydrogenase like protein [Phycisphaerales bacterium]|jgi:NAD(P)-dependent dehydrogenase (short-subunit alcohol dehydrogenase family)|nr:dehydrogenase, short-chain alcohol dehydrogenase like protein [Phycisphaerales bacterium]
MFMIHPGLDISGKVCLVTGGTSGIGRAIALGFAQAGAKTVAGSTNPEKVAAIKEELGGGNDAVRLDVSDAASVRDAVDMVVKKYGRLDAIVNAAGVIKKVPSLEMDPAEFERIVRVNLVGNFIVAQAAGRVMKEQTPDKKGVRGSIVNIASLNSFISLSEVLAYACSKSGVMGLTRGLANEWAQYGIRVNGIAPGVFPTDLNRPLIEGTARGAWLKQHTPMARFGDADEIAGAAIYLISDSASYTTGETIVIDGGFLTRGV